MCGVMESGVGRDGAKDRVLVLWSTELMCDVIEVEEGERSGLQGVSEVMLKVSHPPRPRNECV